MGTATLALLCLSQFENQVYANFPRAVTELQQRYKGKSHKKLSR